jgi:two-component system, OmpR family, response regulator RegX3
VVDPDSMSARLLTALFADAGNEIVGAASAVEALRLAFDAATDVVLTETDCGNPGGFELCAELRGRGFKGPLIFISRRHDLADKLRAFEFGADDFIEKPFDPRELMARIDAAYRRFRAAQTLILSREIRAGDAVLSPGEGIFHIDGRQPAFLSPTEVRLLECLMRDSSITISRGALLERAWPHSFIGDPARVDVFIARIRKKIELDPSEPEYLHTVRGFGYTFRPPVRPRLADAEFSESPEAAASLPGA